MSPYKIQLLTSFLIAVIGIVASKKLETIYEWKYIDFTWESESQKNESIENGIYAYENAVPLGFEIASDGRIFVSLPRFNVSPATLAIVSDKIGPSGPLLTPYPNWEWNSIQNSSTCDDDHLYSVARVIIDKCNTMWVLDNGNYVTGDIKCPVRLLAFDLSTNKLIKKVIIPRDNITDQGTMMDFFVIDDNCPDKVIVFISDMELFALIVWNGNDIIRIENSLFAPVDEAKNFTIGEDTVSWDDGIIGFGLLRNYGPDKSDVLVFRPLSSFSLLYANVTDLLNYKQDPDVKYGGSQNALSGIATTFKISSNGILILGMQDFALHCWNTHEPLKTENIDIALMDKNYLEYVGEMKIKETEREEKLWLLVNRFQKVSTGTYNFEEINFRMLTIGVTELVAGTKCEILEESEQ